MRSPPSFIPSAVSPTTPDLAIAAPSTEGLSRRLFLTSVGAVGVAVGTPMYAVTAKAASASSAVVYGEAGQVVAASAAAGPTLPVTLQVNGVRHALDLDPRTTLLDCLREQLQLTGTKKGCDHGQCGACTVHVNGRRVNSCLTLAATLEGDAITTIEGLGHEGALHPMQAAFLAHDGYQCGYCTSGQIMSSVALLSEPCGPGDADVKECMSGNICRCGAYTNIVAAIQQVRKAV